VGTTSRGKELGFQVLEIIGQHQGGKLGGNQHVEQPGAALEDGCDLNDRQNDPITPPEITAPTGPSGQKLSMNKLFDWGLFITRRAGVSKKLPLQNP
jgi:hypothetical protein